MALRLRYILLALVPAASLAAVAFFAPAAQDPAYHLFADQRSLSGIPRFIDVATNLPFLIIGVAGLLLRPGQLARSAGRSWTLFFASVALVGAGSAFYHLDPNDATLVWDRVPMTVGFMTVLVGVLSERIDGRIEDRTLLPAVLAGILSAACWSATGDLRPYISVQFLTLTVLSAALLLFPGTRRDDRLLALSLLCYAAAKAAELYDHEFYALTGRVISGHSLKHLLAAAGCMTLLVMRKGRSRTGFEQVFVRQEGGYARDGQGT